MEHEKDNEWTERRIELSMMFLQMGRSLSEEANERDDEIIMGAGSLLILLSGLMMQEDKMYSFNELCSLFTAKDILDDIMEGPMGEIIRNDMFGSTEVNLDEMERLLRGLKDNKDDEDEE